MDSPTRRKGDELCVDLENWMSNLPVQLRSMPIIYLAIPGSHDSMTYNINRKCAVSPDAEPIFQKLKWLGPVLRFTMARWSVTQNLDVTKQLHMGVRYFDLRISTKVGTDELYFVHGLYGDDVRGPLNDLMIFLETHPREVVILDCQHFYAFGPSDHERLMRIITSTFGHRLVPFTQHMDHLTLEYLTTQFRYQVFCVYRSDAARFGQPLLWPSASWPTPWPNTHDIDTLITTLATNLRNKNQGKGYVSQCILTPNTWFVIRHALGTLKSQCAIPLEKPAVNWLRAQQPGTNGINIAIADFVDIFNTDFCKIVISLNAKLLIEFSDSKSK